MNVAVYANPDTALPYLSVLSGGLDTLEVAVEKYLVPYGIPYLIVDEGDIEPSPYIRGAQTVDVSGSSPVFDWDMDLAKGIATNLNSEYWQAQYNEGLLGVGITNDYQLNLAIATPEDDRTADQIAAVEFLTGINQLQTEKQDQIDAATTGQELITILSSLG